MHWNTELSTAIDHAVILGFLKIYHFSNPDVKYKGKDTGQPDSRYNADQLSAEACIVAGYRPFNPPFNVTVTGPTFGNSNDGPYTWCIDATGCEEVANVSWEYSTNGFNFFPVSGNSVCWTAHLPIDKHLDIRVTVTCSNGQIDVVWY